MYRVRCSLKELEKNFSDLKAELWELQQEIMHHRVHPSRERDDLFLPSMEEFTSVTSAAFTELEELIERMKSEVTHFPQGMD